MKKNKSLTIFTALLLLSIYFYRYHDNREAPTTAWNTYKKKGTLILAHPTTKSEMRKAKIIQEKKRSPASKSSTGLSKRKVTGPFKEKFTSSKTKFNYLNTQSKNWKSKYADFKLSTLPQGTKLLIKHSESLLRVTSKGALYLEKVIVSVQREGRAPRSYEALVNAQTGKQISAWNRTHHENVSNTIFSKKL